MYIDMDQEPESNPEFQEEVHASQQQHRPLTSTKNKPIKIQKYRANVPSKEKIPTTITPSKAPFLKHPLDDSFDETNSDESNCSEEEYDSLDDISYSSCSTSSDQFKEPSFLQSYPSYYSTSNNSSCGHSIESSRSGISLLSLNGSSPLSLTSTPSTTTAFLTTTSSTVAAPRVIEADTKSLTPYLTPSSSPLSTFVSFEAPSKSEPLTKSPKLHKATSRECLSKVLDKYQPKQSLYSNLTISLKAIKDRLVSRALSDVSVDIISVAEEKPAAVIAEEVPSQELITFFEAKHDHDISQEQIKPSFKNRDHRINPQFLRLYAYDYNARVNSKTLPNSLSQEELMSIIVNNPHLKSFHKKYNIYHISNSSREKLWNSVVLKPRLDKSPDQSIDYEDYICVADNSVVTHTPSLTRKHSKYLPWDLKPSIKPAGVLPGGKWEFNGKAPNSGVSKTQFTVKGWCNSRWVAKTEIK
ncbi:hypothetical protein I9W82_001321 [Candida metapsilosis]|uniref:Uncharacterized protein n=1 Tax=Candida metapsilosis TaxID=273372 RepID=A0A8H8DEU2_9ASCO|nr:hypothetical protein I9W82_001321 [Candida metapsilosis]